MNLIRSGLIIAGFGSGAGKTTVALALIDLFRRKGLTVQPFKAGPDFIDPGLHTQLAGRISRNLDSFLLDAPTVRTLWEKSARSADVAVIEGVAGLYDGLSGLDGRGSTAHVAKILKCPVLLVVDAHNSARSLAAAVKGFAIFDRGVKIAGVFLNRLAGATHLEWCREAIEKECGIPVLGHFFESKKMEMKERHMGLYPAAERSLTPEWLSELRRQSERNIPWKKILGKFRTEKQFQKTAAPVEPAVKHLRIGVARDPAFHFYYQDNLDLLNDLGAETVPFSPISDRSLPENLDALYLGGGFPEVFGKELEDNIPMRREILKKIREGMSVYAECGGLMYLGASLRGYDGKVRRMAGALPYETRMTRKISMAYLDVLATDDNLLASKGEKFPGQVFHFSELKSLSPLRYSWRLSDGKRKFPDGITRGSVLASYLHVHFWSRPSLARNWMRRIAKH